MYTVLFSVLSVAILDSVACAVGSYSIIDKGPSKHAKATVKGHKQVSLPSVLREVRARDQSAQISGYLQISSSRARRWKKRWFVVYNLVLYEFERHEASVCWNYICYVGWRAYSVTMHP